MEAQSARELVLNILFCGCRDGKMVVLGGYDCSNASLLAQTTKSLISLNKADVYDTKTNEWYQQPLKGDIPHPRTFHTAVKCKYMVGEGGY